jgi:hypothetical protein
MYTQEIDPTPDTSDFEQMEWAQDSFLTELAGSIPGIDEAMSFAEVLKQVRCVATLGRRLRLLGRRHVALLEQLWQLCMDSEVVPHLGG